MERFKGKKKQIVLGHLVALLIIMSYILPDVLMVAKNVTTIKAADIQKVNAGGNVSDEIIVGKTITIEKSGNYDGVKNIMVDPSRNEWQEYMHISNVELKRK